MNKYKNYIDRDTELVMPLTAETSGAIHGNFVTYFSTLATRTGNKPPPNATWTTPSFVSYWMAVVSCTLRRETANALLRQAKAARGIAGHHDVVHDVPAPLPAGAEL